MPRQVELSGVSIVGVGAFNPAIFQPTWFLQKALLSTNSAESAREKLLVSPELTVFTADWLSVQVTLQQAIFSTVEEARELELRDLTCGVLDLLPETPVDAVGINVDIHFRVESEDEWHKIGDRFLPKDFWEPVFVGDHWKARGDGKHVGLRTMTAEALREDGSGFVRVEVAPSSRLSPHGVFTGINAHFQLSEGERRGNGYEAAKLVKDRWDETRELESQLLERLLAAE